MKSISRFQLITLICGLLVWLSNGVVTGQESIRPQFMFGGSYSGPQELAIEGRVTPVNDGLEIRSLPPSPNQGGGFGFPRQPNPTQAVGPIFETPNVPELSYPGEPLPSSTYIESRGVNSFQHSPSPSGFSDSHFVPHGFTRNPVVIPNEPAFGQHAPQSSQSIQEAMTEPQFLDRPGNSVTGSFGNPSTVINEGFRNTSPTVRGGPLDDYGQEFDFENKKREYPPFSEILKTGRYFFNAELLYLKPYFQNNTAITVEGPTTGFSTTFDYGYDTGNRFVAGFESKYGPGLQLNYFQYDHQSRPTQFTSSGGYQGETSTWMMGPGRWSRLRTANAGDRLTTEHSLEVQNFGVSFFKDWKLPISRLGGGFGIQYVSIEQDLQARLTDSAGTEIGSLSARHELRAFGPKLEFNYFRPVGHTKLEIIGGFSGAVLFGNRDQTVSNTTTSDISRVGADEFVLIIDVIGGLQYVHNFADNRSVYARVTLMSQAWLGGGTAIVPHDDLGFRGVGFAVGLNR